MLKQDTFEQIKTFLKGKAFHSLKIKNVIGNNGSIISFFYFVEKNDSITYQLVLIDNYINVKKIKDKNYKDYKLKEVQIISDFTIKDINYTEIGNDCVLAFNCTTKYNKKETSENMFNFSLYLNEDRLNYMSDGCINYHLLSLEESDLWTYHPFLSLIEDRKYSKNQLYVLNDILGFPLYVKDKVKLVLLNDVGVIHYDFIKKLFCIKTNNNGFIELKNHKNELILLERNKKEYIGNKNQHTNIISLYDYLIGPSKEVKQIISENYAIHDVEDVYDDICFFIQKEIDSNKLLLDYSKDNHLVTIKQYLQ